MRSMQVTLLLAIHDTARVGAELRRCICMRRNWWCLVGRGSVRSSLHRCRRSGVWDGSESDLRGIALFRPRGALLGEVLVSSALFNASKSEIGTKDRISKVAFGLIRHPA